LLINDGVDGLGEAGEEAHAETVSEAAYGVVPGSPGEAEGRNAVVVDKGREEGQGDEWQAKILGNTAGHVGLVDEQGVEVTGASGLGAVAKDHTGGVFHALDGEAEAG